MLPLVMFCGAVGLAGNVVTDPATETGPTPIAFTAETRTQYFVPGAIPVIRTDRDADTARGTTDHVRPSLDVSTL